MTSGRRVSGFDRLLTEIARGEQGAVSAQVLGITI
jgi:hypothetical protein